VEAAPGRKERAAKMTWRSVFDLAADDAASEVDLKFRGFALLLLVHTSTRLWIWAMRPHPSEETKQLAAIVVTLLALAALWPRWTRTAAGGVALILLGKIIATFPVTSNHAFLEFLAVGLLACFDPRRGKERALAMQTARWGVIIVLFYSGLQKVLYGTYFDAMFLGSFIALKPSFADALGPLLPPAELARLAALPAQEGAGPFAVDSPLLVGASNAVYLFEMITPLFLLWRRTRAPAAVMAIIFTALLQTAAREMMFGALFIGFLLLFPRRAFNLGLLPVFAGLYAALLTMRYFAPEIWFN
jgi:hypothetical protein